MNATTVDRSATGLDFERCYRAVASRDDRFDGWFLTAVTSTGIYCRPSCPALTPRRENVRFLLSAAAAQREGFRACLRCRPDAAPGSPQWSHRADVVGRAMRLIADGVVDRAGVAGLAARLGYTQRHLSRLLQTELGAGPLALARAQRAQTARILIETTRLSLTEIAFAAGFGSIRQFNDTIKQIYARQPGQLRRAESTAGTDLSTLCLRLPYRAPLNSAALLSFLAARTIDGVDLIDEYGYHRALRLPYGPGEATLQIEVGHVVARLSLADVRDLAPAVARCRSLLDLDADPLAIDSVLGAGPLKDAIRAEPGVRVPGATDGFELAVRAIVGQQISVAGARRLLGRLVACAGPLSGNATIAAEPPAVDETVVDSSAGDEPARQLRPFPDPADLAQAPDAAYPMPAARRETIRRLAAAVASGELDLAAGADRVEAVARLRGLKGIGDWTARYIAMRALRDPDVLLDTDLGVRRGAAALGLSELTDHAAKNWAPWRSYATMRLWRQPLEQP